MYYTACLLANLYTYCTIRNTTRRLHAYYPYSTSTWSTPVHTHTHAYHDTLRHHKQIGCSRYMYIVSNSVVPLNFCWPSHSNHRKIAGYVIVGQANVVQSCKTLTMTCSFDAELTLFMPIMLKILPHYSILLCSAYMPIISSSMIKTIS